MYVYITAHYIYYGTMICMNKISYDVYTESFIGVSILWDDCGDWSIATFSCASWCNNIITCILVMQNGSLFLYLGNCSYAMLQFEIMISPLKPTIFTVYIARGHHVYTISHIKYIYYTSHYRVVVTT